MIESVLSQTFTDWELCLVDDRSTSSDVWPVLQSYSEADQRIKVQRRRENGGISAASNDALSMASGEFVVFVDNDDVVVRTALAVVDRELTRNDPIDYCYSDEAKLLPDGSVAGAFYKPDWSPERFRSQMYTCHLGIARRSLVWDIGGFRSEFDGSQDYDLVLRLTERTDRILHVPEMLYLWRIIPGSAASGSDAKPWAYDAGLRALQDHCDRVGIAARVEHVPDLRGNYRVRRSLRREPLVSIIIPTSGSSARVRGVLQVSVLHTLASVINSSYSHTEFVLVADRDTPQAVLAEIARLCAHRLTVVRSDGPPNLARSFNDGVEASKGEVLVLLSDAVEVIAPDWIELLLAHLEEPDCGMVGCKLLNADGTLQHAGHSYRAGEVGHTYAGYSMDFPGDANMLGVARECSGVAAAAAAVRRDAWERVGGMWEELPINLNDVDLSLKVRQLGYRIVWNPFALLYHFESLTRGSGIEGWELERLRSRWEWELSHDPYFNPNLDQGRSDWVVEKSPEAWLP